MPDVKLSAKCAIAGCGQPADHATQTCWYCAISVPRRFIREARDVLAGKLCCSPERRRELREAATRSVLQFTRRFRLN